MDLLGFAGLHFKRLGVGTVHHLQIGIVERVAERQCDIAALGDAVHIDHLGRQYQYVALAQETRHVGHHHQLLAGLHVFFKKARHHIRVVGEAQQLPAGQRLWHRETYQHIALLVGAQVRVEEGGLVEVGAYLDLLLLRFGRGLPLTGDNVFDSIGCHFNGLFNVCNYFIFIYIHIFRGFHHI